MSQLKCGCRCHQREDHLDHCDRCAAPDPIPSPVPEVVQEARTWVKATHHYPAEFVLASDHFAAALIVSEEAREKAEALAERLTEEVEGLRLRVNSYGESIEEARAERDSLRVQKASLEQDLNDAGDELSAVWDVLGKVSPGDAEQLHHQLQEDWTKAGREGKVKLQRERATELEKLKGALAAADRCITHPRWLSIGSIDNVAEFRADREHYFAYLDIKRTLSLSPSIPEQE